MDKEDLKDAGAIIKAVWLTVRSKPVFVTAEGAFLGALGDAIFEGIQDGHLDFSKAGIHRLLISAGGVAFMAVWHTYRPQPGAPPTNPKP